MGQDGHRAGIGVRLRAHSIDKSGFNVLVEQFLLASRPIAMRKRGAASCNIDYLFNNQFDPFIDSEAERAGYTHLIAGTKTQCGGLEVTGATRGDELSTSFERCRQLFQGRKRHILKRRGRYILLFRSPRSKNSKLDPVHDQHEVRGIGVLVLMDQERNQSSCYECKTAE